MMNKTPNTFYIAPPQMTNQYIRYFLANVEPIFRLTKGFVPNVRFSTKLTSSIDILGLLLIYKFFEYTVKKQLFESPSCDLFSNKYLRNELSKHNLTKLVREFVNANVPQEYDLQYKAENDLFIAPLVLTRDGGREEADYIPQVSNYYKYDSSLAGVLLQCLAEIKSNFKEHAVDDTKSIMMAKGNRKEFNMACVDTGEGIVSSFRKSEYGNKPKDVLLRMSIKKDITSKADSDHMGRGLWIVSEIARSYHGTMSLYSEGVYLNQRDGKIKCGECPFWKGTIFYLHLPLYNNNKNLREILTNNGK